MLARKSIGQTSRAAGKAGAVHKKAGRAVKTGHSAARHEAQADEDVAIDRELEDIFARIDRNLEVGRTHLQRIADRA